MGPRCSAPRTLPCHRVRPQTPQNATQVHESFLVNYGHHKQSGGPAASAHLAPAPTGVSCDAATCPQVLAPPEMFCSMGQIEAAASSPAAHEERIQHQEGAELPKTPAERKARAGNRAELIAPSHGEASALLISTAPSCPAALHQPDLSLNYPLERS